MANEIQKAREPRPISSYELLELLDLDERKQLAQAIEIDLPESLNDLEFKEDVAQFSTTTLLSTIVHIRRPFIVMLQEIQAFLEANNVRSRTTIRTIALPSGVNELSLVFEQAMKNAIATALNVKAFKASRERIKERMFVISREVRNQVERITGTRERVESSQSRTFRELSSRMRPVDPSRAIGYDMMAKHLDRHETFYCPADVKMLEEFNLETERVIKFIEDRLRASEEKAWHLSTDTEEAFRQLKDIYTYVRRKQATMTRPRTSWLDNKYRKELDARSWALIVERLRLLQEELLASFDFQHTQEQIYDFLNLEIWRERWRVYEIWMLLHLIGLFKNLGFETDISERVSNGIWGLKFTKDEKPIAYLRSENTCLEVFYQLYTKRANGGDMPDIAIKEQNGRYLLILDPKHGESYAKSGLQELAKRYAAAFSPLLTIIHNAYQMKAYSYERLIENPSCIVASDIIPYTENLRKLESDIRAVLPVELVGQQSMLFLVDASDSVKPFSTRIAQTITTALKQLRPQAHPKSTIVFYAQSIVKKQLLSEMQEDRVEMVFGGGTDLNGALKIASEMLLEMPMPRTLLLFTDGEDTLDGEGFCTRFVAGGLRVHIYEATDSTVATQLSELADKISGQYTRL